MLTEALVFIIFSAIFFYRWATKNYDFFKKRNLAYDKPNFLLGSSKDAILRRKTLVQVLCEIYNRHDGIVYGTFESRQPVLLIRDPLLIKHIMVKDFDHFMNRSRMFDVDSENLLTNSLFFMQNSKWRDMRSTLSPAFTGSKMRHMFDLMLQKVDEAMNYLKNHQREICSSNNQEGFEVDIKDISSRLTNDIIASTAFGLQVNSFRDKENEFYIKARKAINFTAWQQFKMMFIMVMPKLAKIMKIEIFDKEFSDYFMRLVLDAIKYRKENNIHRPDMVNLLMEARGLLPTETTKTHYREWSDVDMVAQCFLFYLAGFEPSSGTMSFTAHELMEYPDVQEKLYEEIQDINHLLQGNAITYELLQKMPYLDMVVSEVLRKWPVTLVTDRVCTKDYIYETTEGERIEIKKGEMLRIPMIAIQRFPKFYEQPEILNPERFIAENKSKIENSGTYLPFGLGPRNCIGNRFALLETKAFLYYLVRDYRLEASPKSTVPLELDTKSIQLKPKNGFWIQLKPRN